MSSLSDYLEGVLRVPLALLTSDGFSECPTAFSDGASVSDFEGFLSNRDQPITGIISPKRLDEISDKLVITRQQLQQTLTTQEPLSNSQFKIDCLLGQHCLSKAKELLGQNHECIVRIYSIPPELPGRYSDGEICRQVLLLHKRQPSLAQKWLERLSKGKRKHVTMVFHRDGIWSAMHQVAVFPGLWHDIKLGNWAKHLAAHIDEQIMTYWRHIYRAWNDVIFNGVDPSLRQSVDASSTRFLQFMAPAWSEKDQEAIRERMKNGTLFCNISSEEERSRLLRNLLAFEGVIPSILTFHENMRYLTVGAKILEKYIEVKRPTEKAKPDLAPLKTPESLLGNLAQDWGKHFPVLNLVECKEGLYQTVHAPLQVRGAFLQLMLAALRSFPFLSSEAPLQDIKGIGMNAFVDDMSRSRLCKMASAMGFWNEKIEKGLQLPNQDVQREIPDFIVLRTEEIWRGGLPTISVFRDLHTKSFLPSLASAGKDVKVREPNAALIQFDFVCAFFGRFDLNVDQSSAGLSIEDLRNPIFDSSAIVPDDSEPMTDAPSIDVTTNMNWAEESVAFTSEALAAATNQPPSARQKGQKPRKQKDHGPLTRKPERAIAKAKPNTKLSKEAKEKAKKMAREPLRIFGGEAPILPVPEGMDMDEPDVPEAYQRISAPNFDGLDTSQQGRPQQPLVEPHIEPPAEAHAETPVRPPATSEIEPEVPESHQRISAPNVEGYDMLVNLLGGQPQKQPQKQPQEQPQIILRDPDEEAEQRHQQRKQEALELQKQLEEEQQQRPSRLPRAKPYSRLEKDKPSKAMIEIRKHHNDEEPEPNKRQRIDEYELEIPHRLEARLEGINPYEEEEL